MVRSLALGLLVVLAVGCHSPKAPELRVLGMHQARAEAHEIVYVQVTNPANRPMRLTKLEYVFAASTGTTVSEGEVALGAREVPAGAAVMIEVPLDEAPDKAITLRGKLVAEQDHIVKSFKVSAQIQPMK